MIATTALPAQQASAPAGFAAFLNTIGQSPSGGGEDGGFEQLLAAIPAVDVAAAKAVPVTPAAGADQVAASDKAIAEPVTNDKASEVEVTADPDKAAAAAAKLLIAVNGSGAGAAASPGKAAATGSKTDRAQTTDERTIGTASAAVAPTSEPTATTSPAIPTTSVVAPPVVASLVAAAIAGKPAKASDPTSLSISDAAPIAEDVIAVPIPARPSAADAKPLAPAAEAAIAALTASKPRPATAPTLIEVGTEPVTAKPADTAPAMTIQFTQPVTTGAAMLANAAQPVAITERTLDLASDGAWIDQLAHDIAATKSDSGDVSFRLMPRHLGRLDVAMVMGDDGVALKLNAQHEATATIVIAAQGRLVEELRQQGVRVAESEVTCTPGETGRQSQSQSQSQGRAAAQDVSHLIETVTERAKARDSKEAADRRGRFA